MAIITKAQLKKKSGVKGAKKKKGKAGDSNSLRGVRADVKYVSLKEAIALPLAFRAGERIKPVKGAPVPKWLEGGKPGATTGIVTYRAVIGDVRIGLTSLCYHYGAQGGTAYGAMRMLAENGVDVSSYTPIRYVAHGIKGDAGAHGDVEKIGKSGEKFVAQLVNKYK